MYGVTLTIIIGTVPFIAKRILRLGITHATNGLGRKCAIMAGGGQTVMNVSCTIISGRVILILPTLPTFK